ncbi:MAG: zf-HC2 domain-containing protein [Candidatus Omnitrophota bacterium]
MRRQHGMQDKLERIISMVYKSWKQSGRKGEGPHLDEEALACFVEGRLSQEEAEPIKAHLVRCEDCMEALVVSLKVSETSEEEPSAELLERVRKMLAFELKPALLEIALRLKEKALEMIGTTGDVLVGQELVPAPVLRSRSIKNFKDEVTILKDFDDIRAEIKIENKGGLAFNLTLLVKHKLTQKIIKDLRVSLIKDETELESCLTDSGLVTFEHILLGKYTVLISRVDSKLASISLDIRQ